MQNTTMAPRRSRGVTIIAILAALQGVFLLFISGFGFLGFLTTLSTAPGAPLPNLIVAGLSGAILPIAALLLLLAAWGLWTLKRWAFFFTVVVQLLSLFGSINMLAQTGDATTTSTTSNIILSIGVLIYLFADRNVRAAFRT